jgi:sugar O-acyltransferase (sialic acid O-acetyltransferase NeuD family)
MKLALLGINTITQLAVSIAAEGSQLIELFGYDDDINKIGKNFLGVTVFGAGSKLEADVEVGKIDSLIICFGEKHLKLKKSIFKSFEKLNFPNMVSKSAILSHTCKMGIGNILSFGVIVGHNTLFKDNIVVWAGAVIEHDCIINSHSYIGPNVTISGFVEIGECTLIGSGAVILPEIKIGNNCVIGAGAVVTKNIPDNSIVKGNPAI